MNRLLLSLLAALSFAKAAAAQATNPIQRLPLNPMIVTRIPIALDRLTTIRFPSPLSDLQSALVAAEPHPDALFLVVFQPGSAFFSLRALATNASTTLNVVWNNQTCVLELVESKTPCLSAIFELPSEPPATNRHARVASASLPDVPVPTLPPQSAPAKPLAVVSAPITPAPPPVKAPTAATKVLCYKLMPDPARSSNKDGMICGTWVPYYQDVDSPPPPTAPPKAAPAGSSY